MRLKGSLFFIPFECGDVGFLAEESVSTLKNSFLCVNVAIWVDTVESTKWAYVWFTKACVCV